MKRRGNGKKNTRRRVTAGLMAALLCILPAANVSAEVYDGVDPVTDLFPMQSEISLTELEGEAQPGEETHKGFIRTCMIVYSENGVTQKEVYLPVIVNGGSQVYVSAEVISKHLGLKTKEISPREMGVVNEGGTVLFRDHSSRIWFEPEDGSFEQKVRLDGHLPVTWYDERCCVGLDDYLNAVGAYTSYQDDVLEIVYINIPTKLSAYRHFFAKLEDRYRFLIPDLGISEGRQDQELLFTQILSYLSNFWDTDLVRYTLACPIPTKGAQDFAWFFHDKSYMEKYTAYQATWNNDIGEKILNFISRSTAPVSQLLSFAGKKNLISGKNIAGLMKKMDIGSASVRKSIETYGDKIGKYLGGDEFGTDSALLGNVLSLASMIVQYENGDDYDVEAAQTFLDNWNAKGSYLSGEMIHVIGEELKYYRRKASDSKVDLAWNYLEGKAVSVYIDLLAALGIELISPELLVWSAGFKLVSWGASSRADAYLAGYYGVSYELDAIRIAEEKYRQILRMSAPSDEDWQELEYLSYNAAKSCYAVRSLVVEGCSGIKDERVLAETKREQEAINKEIADACASLRNSLASFGRTPAQMQEDMLQEFEHISYVIFNIAEISGQIMDAETQAPAGNVRIGIFGDEEESLIMGTTDAQGYFTLAFDLDDGDIFDERPDIRDLTLHLLTEKYAETIVPLTVQSGHRYRIDGLHTGEISKETYLYLTGASLQNGAVILDVHLAVMEEDTIMIQPPDWLGTGDPIYCPMGGQLAVETQVTRLMLPSGFSFSTVYGHAFDGLEWAGLLMDEMTGSDETTTLMKDELKTADDINTYTQLYNNINGEYPAYRMYSSNSRVKKLEPIFIVAG